MWWCTDDLGRWGLNNAGPLLHDYQVDQNFWELLQRIVNIEEHPIEPVSIANITMDHSGLMTITMTDASTFHLVTPIADIFGRGIWALSTHYYKRNVFGYGNSAYIVNVEHTSALTFDPGANDGNGHNYYTLLFTIPAGLPAGGATGQFLTKASNADYVFQWLTLLGVSPGGDSGYVYIKHSSADGDATWLPFTFDLITGTISPSQLPFPTLTTIGGVLETDGVAHKFLTSIDADGTAGLGQPHFIDLASDKNAFSTTTGTVSVDPTLYDLWTLVPTGDMTINLTATPTQGTELDLVITTSGTTSRNITFGTHFKSQGVLATGTVSGKVFCVSFKSDGVNMVERGARGSAM